MTRFFAACLVIVAALTTAPLAAADPEDRLPYCSADQSPMDVSCKPVPQQAFTEDAPGANPGVPLGTNPGYAPLT